MLRSPLRGLDGSKTHEACQAKGVPATSAYCSVRGKRGTRVKEQTAATVGCAPAALNQETSQIPLVSLPLPSFNVYGRIDDNGIYRCLCSCAYSAASVNQSVLLGCASVVHCRPHQTPGVLTHAHEGPQALNAAPSTRVSGKLSGWRKVLTVPQFMYESSSLFSTTQLVPSDPSKLLCYPCSHCSAPVRSVRTQ